MQDTLVKCDSISSDGNRVNTDGQGNLNAVSLGIAMSSATAQAVATGTAIILIPSGASLVRLTAAAATTGASLPAGTRTGQILVIQISTAAANTVTFAAVGTSLVAGGAAVSMAGLASHLFVWDNVASLWYQVGPLTN